MHLCSTAIFTWYIIHCNDTFVYVILLTMCLNNDYDMHSILHYPPLCFMCYTDSNWNSQGSQTITTIIGNYCDLNANVLPLSAYMSFVLEKLKESAVSAPSKKKTVFLWLLTMLRERILLIIMLVAELQ